MSSDLKCTALFAALLIVSVGVPRDSFGQARVHTIGTELEALFRIDQLPSYRPGSVMGMTSSYDRTGGNDDGFSGKYSYVRQEGDRRLVIADLKGPGIVHRIWTPTPTHDMLAFYFDGERTPRLRLRFSDLFSGSVFPFMRPIVGNEIGGYYSYVPLPFARSLKIVLEGERIEFQQISYRLLPKGERVESYQPSWSEAAQAQLERARERWNAAASGAEPIAPPDARRIEQSFQLKPGESIDLFKADRGGRIMAFELEPADAFSGSYKDVVLDAKWDDDPAPAIHSPVADFFGFAYGKPAMRSVVLGTRNNIAYSLMPMPFDRSASLRLSYEARAGIDQPVVAGKARIWFSERPRNAASEGKFYSLWRREQNPTKGEPYLLLDASGRGHHVGTILIAQGLTAEMTGFFEGDDVATIDGDIRMHGTGSEDAFNGGWYALADRWDRAVNLPTHGALDYSVPNSRTGAYRVLLGDKSSFERSMRFTIEHGPERNEWPVDYTSLAFYYGDTAPRRIMEPTDRLRINPQPTQHKFYPQLMKLTVLHGTSVENLADVIVRTQQDGFVRIAIDEVPHGRYKLFLSYTEHPAGTAFSVWQRQRLIADWRSTRADTERYLDRQPLGEIVINDEVDTVTIRTRKEADRNEFKFRFLTLERLN
jgi:Protein of unknown function (DUF2961)